MNDPIMDIEVYKKDGDLFVSYIAFNDFGTKNLNCCTWQTKKISNEQAKELTKLLVSFNKKEGAKNDQN